MREELADGMKGCMLYNPITRNLFFRVYNPDNTFKDYDIRVDELWVTINDEDNSLYEDGEKNTLTWSSKALGKIPPIAWEKLENVNPYQEQTFEAPLNEMRMLKYVEIECIAILDSSSADDIKDSIESALKKVKEQGYSNVKIRGIYDLDGDGYERHYLKITGDRMETSAEHEKRMDGIIRSWQTDYEHYLNKKAYWENELGQARLAEVKQKSKRPISYPKV